ncbi:MAG: hypothetical protein H0W70_12335 [Actinobacteria bacterium]|nr:hypothetical protein [Actinomycetota bacterium]
MTDAEFPTLDTNGMEADAPPPRWPRWRGTQFDPDVVRTFLPIVSRFSSQASA